MTAFGREKTLAHLSLYLSLEQPRSDDRGALPLAIATCDTAGDKTPQGACAIRGDSGYYSRELLRCQWRSHGQSFTDVGTPSPRKLFGAGEAATNILE